MPAKRLSVQGLAAESSQIRSYGDRSDNPLSMFLFLCCYCALPGEIVGSGRWGPKHAPFRMPNHRFDEDLLFAKGKTEEAPASGGRAFTPSQQRRKPVHCTPETAGRKRERLSTGCPLVPAIRCKINTATPIPQVRGRNNRALMRLLGFYALHIFWRISFHLRSVSPPFHKLFSC